MNNLKIEPVKIDESELNVIEHGYFKFPSLHLVIGKVASGKSTFINNLISKIFNPVFKDNVILFSSTAGNDPILKELIDNEKIFFHFPNYNRETLETILEMIKDDDTDDRYLIVFDDMANLIPKTMSKDGQYFNNFIANFRHYAGEGKVSLIITTQKYTTINSFIRSNSHYVYLLGRASQKDLKTFSEELNAITEGNEQKFLECYNQCKSDKYDIMLLDFINLRVMKNLDTLIHDDNERFDSVPSSPDIPEEKK